jgi:pectate lyase
MLSQKYITPEMLQQYFKFTVVRNPIDRLYSTYVYLGYSNVFNFDTFIQHILPKIYKQKNYFLRPQYSFIEYEGKILMNQICRLESLNDDFKIVAKKIKIANHNLPKINKSKQEQNLRGLKKIFENYHIFYKTKFSLHTPHKKQFSQKSRQILLDYYRIDFEKFDYDL